MLCPLLLTPTSNLIILTPPYSSQQPPILLGNLGILLVIACILPHCRCSAFISVHLRHNLFIHPWVGQFSRRSDTALCYGLIGKRLAKLRLDNPLFLEMGTSLSFALMEFQQRDVMACVFQCLPSSPIHIHLPETIRVEGVNISAHVLLVQGIISNLNGQLELT